MKHSIKFKKNKIFLLLILFSLAPLYTSCDIFELEEEEEEYNYEDDNDNGSGNQNAGYDYTFNCPISGEATVPIPPGSSECQQAYEFFARTYGCNDVENFNEANCRLCYDCQDDNYCSVCD